MKGTITRVDMVAKALARQKDFIKESQAELRRLTLTVEKNQKPSKES